ncbi:hypothetical protein [Izhakiella capsodis]|uniref:hypothetical protein n=1 Tax=Izhakiella capsodis TaxID=1367852 RepID=UPI000B8137EE|nr:hypothetical protein [Izhakiella capsodis]
MAVFKDFLAADAKKMLPACGVLYISVTDGVSSAPVAVKIASELFPSSLTFDDNNVSALIFCLASDTG